jgi:EmrB/QacA subfamily drug resistance transporter
MVLVFVGILFGNTMSALDASIVATAAPTIIGDLGTVALLPWLTTSYLLAQVCTMPLYGKLGDLHGRKRIFTIAILVFLAGSVACGLAQSMSQLVAFRVVQGIGAGGITGMSMALVADVVPAHKLARYLGYTGLVFGVTSVLGPLIGGIFVDNFSWRWVFLINVPSGIICLITLWFVPRQARRVRHRLDWQGALLLAVSVAALLLGLTRTEAGQPFLTPRSTALFALSALAAVVFVWQERRAVEPLLPLRVVSNRIAGIATFANLVAGFAFTVCIIYPPIFFQAVAGTDATLSGLLLVPFALTTALSTLVAGQITDRWGGYRTIPVIGMALLVVAYALLGTISADTAPQMVTAMCVVAGVGVGFVMQTLLFVVQRSSPPADIGVSTSTVMLSRVLGSSLGVAVIGSVFTARLLDGVDARLPGFPIGDIQGDPKQVAALADAVRSQVQEAFAYALQGAFRVAVPVMLIGLVVTLLLPARRVAALVRAGTLAPPRPEPATPVA